LAPDVVKDFFGYINQNMLDPYLPPNAGEGLEIGPGGGRVTALLVPRTELLYLADASEAMLQHLKKRFAAVSNLKYYHTDGVTLPPLKPSSLDYVIAFDVFVHFEPRLIFWYLRQIVSLLKVGGTGIIHYGNALTPLGWRTIEADLETNCTQRTYFGAFGIMCPQLMEKFLEILEVEVISLDLGIIPRDAITVFRKTSKTD
jgi:SAM-dependent methyltransferase